MMTGKRWPRIGNSGKSLKCDAVFLLPLAAEKEADPENAVPG